MGVRTTGDGEAGTVDDGVVRRSAETVAERVRELVAAGWLELPDPGQGRTADRWTALAELGRTDLALARLAEGHTDATSILRQAGREPVRGAVYGVWAARSGGTGAMLSGTTLTGTVRFCSGAHSLDRALVAASGDDGKSVLLDVALDNPRISRIDGTWQPLGMDASDSPDVVFGDVTAKDPVGPPGFYTERPGFWWGGGGVAAVWYGGCAGLLDRTEQILRNGRGPDDHQLAHLGELHAMRAATAALMHQTAALIDSGTQDDVVTEIWTLRSSAEQCARAVVDRVPRIVGPTPLSRDRSFAQSLADLQVYVRQHHAERDYAALGRRLFEAAR